jgi:hypothetical protein
MARPTEFTEIKFDEICSIIASTNLGLSSICSKDDMPDRVTFYRWMKGNEELCNKYARAKEDQADFLAEEILEIADNKDGDTVPTEFGEAGNAVNVQRSRLQVDARKWIASKLKPKKYGEKLDIDQRVIKIGKDIDESYE